MGWCVCCCVVPVVLSPCCRGMPRYAVNFHAELDGIASVAMNAEGSWRFTVRCQKCNEVMPTPMDVDPNESVEVNGGTAQAARQCKACKANTVMANIEPKSEGIFRGGVAPATVLVVEFRGGVPEGAEYEGKYHAVATVEEEGDDGTTFEFEGFEGGEYADYDEKMERPVTISKPTFSIGRA